MNFDLFSGMGFYLQGTDKATLVLHMLPQKFHELFYLPLAFWVLKISKLVTYNATQSM